MRQDFEFGIISAPKFYFYWSLNARFKRLKVNLTWFFLLPTGYFCYLLITSGYLFVTSGYLLHAKNSFLFLSYLHFCLELLDM